MSYYNPYVQMLDQANAAPLGGAAAGFLQGGPAGAVIGGVTGMLQRRAAFGKVDDALRQLDTNPDLVDTDPYGRPVFNSAGALDATHTMNDLNGAVKRRKKGLRGLFANSDDLILNSQMSIKAGMLNNGLQDQRDLFNNQMTSYNEQQAAMAQYNQLLNQSNRLNNLYSIGTSLY